MGSPFYIDSVKRQILLPTNIKESSPGKDNFQSLLWKYRCKPYNKRYHRFCIFQYIFRIWNFFLPSINCHWTDFHRMGNPKNIFKIYQIAIGCNLHYMSMLGFHKTHNHLGNLYCMDMLKYGINLGLCFQVQLPLLQLSRSAAQFEKHSSSPQWPRQSI